MDQGRYLPRDRLSAPARGEDWAITGRAFPAALGKVPEGACERELLRQISLVAPPDANTARQAVLRSAIGGAREVVRSGGALELARIAYRDDYRHVYALRGPRGGLLRLLPGRGNRITGIIA